MQPAAEKEQLLIDPERMYSLTRDTEGRHYLEVLKGGIAMEVMVVPLDADELARFAAEGKDFLDTLALRILWGWHPKALQHVSS